MHHTHTHTHTHTFRACHGMRRLTALRQALSVARTHSPFLPFSPSLLPLPRLPTHQRTANPKPRTAKYKPHMPTICITPSDQAARQMSLSRGMFPRIVGSMIGRYVLSMYLFLCVYICLMVSLPVCICLPQPLSALDLSLSHARALSLLNCLFCSP